MGIDRPCTLTPEAAPLAAEDVKLESAPCHEQKSKDSATRRNSAQLSHSSNSFGLDEMRISLVGIYPHQIPFVEIYHILLGLQFYEICHEKPNFPTEWP